jgi:HAMP domain-containing protein
MQLTGKLNLALVPVLLAGCAAVCGVLPDGPGAMARAGLVLAIFLLTGLLFNLAWWALALRPLRRLAQVAEQASLGVPADDFECSGGDEIGRLAGAVARLRRSLAQALHLLGP